MQLLQWKPSFTLGIASVDTEHRDMINAVPGWQTRFNALDVDVAVLYGTDPLVGALKSEGWRQVMTDKGFVLLERGTAQ